MRNPVVTLLACLTLSLFSGSLHAQQSSEEAEEESPGIVDKATVYVDEAQRKATQRFSGFMNQVDGFFSDATTNEGRLNNDSWARIRLDANQPAGEDFEVKPSLKVRVSLPNTEKRFKLLFSTEDDDTDVVGSSVDRLQGSVVNSDSNASAAIRFIRSARDNGNADVDIGVRQREGDIQYFGRLVLGYRKMLARKWNFSASNSYWHYSKSGFENRLTTSFQRKLFYQENLFIRSHSEINWRKGRKGAVIGQTFGVYSQLSEEKALAFELIAGYHTALNNGLEDRFRGHEFRLRWRHNVWRPWFFYEVWPSISWPATADYEKSYGILLRMEMVIGER
ncbi:hypothetical protein ACUNV4_24835 [Granulosicoccus sp. 3-233]|uniref:hypothetical protein n=1 Tax=Granulosicoccus sp. 3-233 TaxID=3417969 RepID=UPI003D329DD4